MDANEIVHVISPGNDLGFVAQLWKDVLGVKTPLTAADGAATVEIGDAEDADAPADPALVGTATWMADAKAPQKWSILYNASLVKDAALKAQFASGAKTPYLIVRHPGGIAAVAKL
jgi:hypothetical protein